MEVDPNAVTIIGMPEFNGRHESRLARILLQDPYATLYTPVLSGSGKNLDNTLPYDERVMLGYNGKVLAGITAQLELSTHYTPIKLFFMDVWNPIIPAIRQCAILGKWGIQIAGLLHNSSRTNQFLAGLSKVEEAILDCVDYVVTPSRVLTSVLEDTRGPVYCHPFPIKMPVPPFTEDSLPLFSIGYENWAQRKYDFVWPYNPLDPDRNFDTMLRLHEVVGGKWLISWPNEDTGLRLMGYPDIDLVCPKTVKEYTKALQSARFVAHTSKVETYGLSVLEAMANGCVLAVADQNLCTTNNEVAFYQQEILQGTSDTKGTSLTIRAAGEALSLDRADEATVATNRLISIYLAAQQWRRNYLPQYCNESNFCQSIKHFE